MLIAVLAAIALFFAGLWAFTAFDNAMSKEERAAWKRRALDAEAGRKVAEIDALSAIAAADEAQEKITRLSSHVRGLMRERSQQQSLQLPTMRVFEIDKSPEQKAATRSASLN